MCTSTKCYCLGQKEGRPMLSNWTKHISKCVLTSKYNAGVTRTIHQYLITNEAPPSRLSSSTTASAISSYPNDLFPSDVEEQLLNSMEQAGSGAGSVEEKGHHFSAFPSCIKGGGSTLHCNPVSSTIISKKTVPDSSSSLSHTHCWCHLSYGTCWGK